MDVSTNTMKGTSMKQVGIIVIAIGLLLPTVNTLAQTEVWRVPYNGYSRYTRGDNGSIYMWSESFIGGTNKDTLRKVFPNGSVDWQVQVSNNAVPKLGQLLFSGNGVYLLFINADSVAYYDTSGTRRWGFVFPGPVYWAGAVDPGGDFYAIVHSSPESLIKLDKGGAVKYNTVLPLFNLPNPSTDYRRYNAPPFFDKAGNVWVSLLVRTITDKTSSSGTSSETDQFIYISKLNSSNGVPLTPSKPFIPVLKKEKIFYSKTSSSGKVTTLDAWGDPTFYPSLMVDDHLIYVDPNYEVITSTGTATTTTSYQDRSLSRLLVVNSGGKAKIIKFQGKGLDVCKSALGTYKVDNTMNYMYAGPIRGLGDFIYFAFATAAGKGTCGVPALQPTGTMMKFDLLKGKPVLVLSSPDQLNVGEFIAVSAADKVFRMSNSHTILVYNGNGSVGTSVLSFADNIQYWPDGAAGEEGFLYLDMYASSNYLAKYSLPPLFVAENSSPTAWTEQPEQFKLEQNFPNPFNPTTTISFELAQPSLVTLKIYDMLGREVVMLLNREEMTDGHQEAVFNASHFASGVYFYRLVAEGIPDAEAGVPEKTFTQIKRMILMK